MKKKYILLASILIVSLIAITSVNKFVHADDNNNNQGDSSALGQDHADNQGDSSSLKQVKNSRRDSKEQDSEDNSSGTNPHLSISGSGHVTLTNAKLTAISGQNLTVTMFGLPFTITVMTSSSTSTSTPTSTTRIIGVTDFSHIVVGDLLSIRGTIDQNSGIITASVVRDQSQGQQTIDSIKHQIQLLLQELQMMKGQAGN